MIQAGVGLSTKTEDPMLAGKEACQQAASSIRGDPDLIIALSSVALHHPEVVSGIHEVFPATPMVGCSTAGEIVSSGPSKESVVVMALKSDQMHFTVAKGGIVKDDARASGRMLAENIKRSAPEDVTSMIMFSDVLAGNGTEISRGVLEVFGQNFVLVGGAAGDDLNFKDTHEYFNGEVLSGYTVGVGLSGHYKKGVGAKHGWEKVGADKIVTRAKGTTVFEIDGKPAFETYKEYLGDKAEEMKKGVLTQIGLTYPLGMSNPKADGVMIRTPLVINKDGSIVFGAEVIEGSTVSIMLGSTSRAIEAAEEVARNVASEFKDAKPKALFVSDCIARKMLYGPNVSEEIDRVTSIIGKDIPLIGFYSYGQHAPVYGISADINSCDPGFYEESIVLFAIGE